MYFNTPLLYTQGCFAHLNHTEKTQKNTFFFYNKMIHFPKEPIIKSAQ